MKIRGFRIELSEIENAINALEGVEKGVVVDVVHRESKRLAAYLLMARGVASILLSCAPGLNAVCRIIWCRPAMWRLTRYR